MAFRVVTEYFSDIDQGSFKLAVVEIYRVVNGDRESTPVEQDDTILSLFPPLPDAYLPGTRDGCNYGRFIRFRSLEYNPTPETTWFIPQPYKPNTEPYADLISLLYTSDLPVVLRGERRRGEILALL